VTLSPAILQVRAIVERHDDNRQLAIVADSVGFFRSSLVEIDGALAPKVHSFRLVGLPAGNYVVRAEMTDARGDVVAAIVRPVRVLDGMPRETP
jgi:hypothetical protein